MSFRPETITEVNEATRTQWVTETADRTIDRIRADEDSAYKLLVGEKYDDVDLTQYKEAVIEALESLQDGERTNPEGDTEAKAEAEVDAEAEPTEQ